MNKKLILLFSIFFISFIFISNIEEKKVYAENSLKSYLNDFDIPDDIMQEIYYIDSNNTRGVILGTIASKVAAKGIITVATSVAAAEVSNPGIISRIFTNVLTNLPQYYQMLINGTQVGVAFILSLMGYDISDMVEDENVRYEIEYDSKLFQPHHFEKYGLEWLMNIPFDYTESWDFPKKSLITGSVNNFEMGTRYYDWQHKHGRGFTISTGMVFPDVDYSLNISNYYYEYQYGWMGLRIQHVYSFPNTNIELVVEGTKRLSENQMDNGVITDILYKLTGISNAGSDVIYVGGLDSNFTNSAQSDTSYWTTETFKFIQSVKKYLNIDLIMPQHQSSSKPYLPGRLFDLSLVGNGTYSHGYKKPFTKFPEYIEIPEPLKNPELEPSKVEEILKPLLPLKVPTVTRPEHGEHFPKPKPPNEIKPEIKPPQAPSQFPGFVPYPQPMPDIELKPSIDPEPLPPINPDPIPPPVIDPTGFINKLIDGFKKLFVPQTFPKFKEDIIDSIKDKMPIIDQIGEIKDFGSTVSLDKTKLRIPFIDRFVINGTSFDYSVNSEIVLNEEYEKRVDYFRNAIKYVMYLIYLIGAIKFLAPKITITDSGD